MLVDYRWPWMKVSNISGALGQSTYFFSGDPLRNLSVDTGVFDCSAVEDTSTLKELWAGRVSRCVRLFVPLGAKCTIVGRLVVDGGGLRITAHPVAGFGLFRFAPFFEVRTPLLLPASHFLKNFIPRGLWENDDMPLRAWPLCTGSRCFSTGPAA